jgi:hypothetical protein
MKTIDVSKRVMGKVVRLERGRAKQWVTRFLIAVGALSLSLVTLGYLTVRIISERQGWDLLTLFQQDPEIIAAYWRDTVWIFWEEAPQRIVIGTVAILIVIISVMVLTRRRRNILQKKLHQLDKYRIN